MTVPYKRSQTAGQTTLTCFGGILVTEFLEPPPGRGFAFRQTYHPTDNPADWTGEARRILEAGIKPAGPPPHIHFHTDEYFKVEQGILRLDMDGKILTRTADDPEIVVPANTWHGFSRHPDSKGPMTVILSGTLTGRDYELDRLFFENWYGVWNDSVVNTGKLNYVEHVQLYDAGDAYMPPPRWVPFPKMSAYLWALLVGRGLGRLMGYKPFHPEYTTNWEYALAKMNHTEYVPNGKVT